MRKLNRKRRTEYLAALLLIGVVLLAAGSFSLALAQEATPTAEATPTPTSTVAVEATPASDGDVTLEELSLEEVVSEAVSGIQDLTWPDALILLISFGIIGLVVVYGTKLVHALLRRLTRRTPTTFDDTLLEVLKPQIRWLIAAICFQVATARLEFITGFWESVLQFTYFLLYLFVALATVWRAVDYSVQWYSENLGPDVDPNVRDQLLPWALHLAHFVLGIVGIAAVLGYFGVNLLATMAALGLSGFAISLAAKDTITNIISGIVILFDKPFAVGDRIEVPGIGTWGDVLDIGIRSTRVVTRDNRLVIIPNSVVVDAEVVNYSQPDPTYRLEVDLGIGYGVNIPWVKKILEDTVRGVEGVLEDKPVDILFTGFGDSAMTFRVRWWVATPGEKRRVTDRVCTAIQQAAEEKGIDMPNPTHSLETSVRMGTEDTGGIPEAIGESAEAIATQPVDRDERDFAGTGQEALETHHT